MLTKVSSRRSARSATIEEIPPISLVDDEKKDGLNSIDPEKSLESDDVHELNAEEE